MVNAIEVVQCGKKKGQRCSVKTFGVEQAQKAYRFHKTFPEYSETPLWELKNLASDLGVASIYIKDESYRFGLNAFKVLGGSYCIGNYIAEQLGIAIDVLSYEKIIEEEVKNRLGNLTFVTATDGNHGRGIAWTAQKFGYKSVVYMPKGTTLERLNNIKELGSEAAVTQLNYDDTVQWAEKIAQKNGWILVQDTSWEGYEKIPEWIMKGYTTMAYEVLKQLKNEKPTHIFLQAGVGAMAGAIAGFFADAYGEKDKPMIIIVESNQADCIFRTAQASDGRLHEVNGALDTIMAGLACGKPCSIGWEILQDYAESFMAVPDYVAAKGMRILGNPVGDDSRIISGESGAVTLGVVAELMQNRNFEQIRKQLKLDRNSKILCFSTEGDTDRENYRRVVWDGLYSNPVGTL